MAAMTMPYAIILSTQVLYLLSFSSKAMIVTNPQPVCGHLPSRYQKKGIISWLFPSLGPKPERVPLLHFLVFLELYPQFSLLYLRASVS